MTVAGLVLLCLGCCFIAYLVRKRRSIKRYSLAHSEKQLTTDSDSILSVYSSKNNTITNITNISLTMLVTVHELLIPAFLEVDSKDYAVRA